MTSFQNNDDVVADPFLAPQETFHYSPNKKVRIDDNATCYDDAPFGVTINSTLKELEPSSAKHKATFMTEDSSDPPKDNITEQEPPPVNPGDDSPNLQPSEEEAAWEAVVQKIQSSDPNSSSFQHLQAFLDGVERRQAALQRMEVVFQKVQESLDQITQQLLGNAADLHGHMFEQMEALEKDIQYHLIQNHQRRQAFQSSLDQWNATLQSNYESLLHRVRLGGEENEEQVSASTETNDLGGGMNPDSTNGGEDGTAEEEPNWNELLEHEPSRANVHAFLQGREQWQTGQERFGVALDEIHANLKTILSNVLQTIVDAIDQMNESTEAQLMDIRNHLGSNFERREYLECAVQEAAQHQQSMFSKLMASVVSSQMVSNLMNFRPGRRKPDNDVEMQQQD